MRHDQPVIINIPLSLNRQSPLQYQLRLVRYTAQLRALLDSPPKLCAECSADFLNTEILDNYLWAVGELINGLFNLKNKSQLDPHVHLGQEHLDHGHLDKKEHFTGSEE